jgi:hypothetical protein
MQSNHETPDAAEPQPNRSWILQEAAEDTEDLINRRNRGWSQIGIGAQSRCARIDCFRRQARKLRIFAPEVPRRSD